MTRNREELIGTSDPAWPEIIEWIKDKRAHASTFDLADKEKSAENLISLQISDQSMLGSVLLNSKKISIRRNCLKILGSSGEGDECRDLLQWNMDAHGLRDISQFPYLLVADDAVGGFFAINAFGIEDARSGEICYSGPDDLEQFDPIRSR